jgi:putative transposase
MPRSIRIQFPSAHYHVMARGNRREAIFLDEEDRRFFLHTLSEACEMTGWRVHAWVLMENHYHLLAPEHGDAAVQCAAPGLGAGVWGSV